MIQHWRNRRVLVTGGGGFLGRVVCRRLRDLGADVRAPGRSDYDLMRPEDTARMLDDVGPDLVVHLAARVGGIGANMAAPADLYLANLLMGTYLIEEARRARVAKTVLVGTICSYPKYAPVPFSEDSLWDGYPEETNAPYGLAKKALLVHAQANRAQYGQRIAYLLPTNLYGPGDKFHPGVSHVIPALVKKYVEAQERGEDHVAVWGTGTATREFLYVEDAAEGVLLAAERYDDADPVNLGSGAEVTISELAGKIGRLVGFTGEVRWDQTKPDGQPRRLVDVRRAEKMLGFRARTTLEEGLQATIAWYRANRALAEATTTL